MKGLNSSDSLMALISICPSTGKIDDQKEDSCHVYGRDYRIINDEEECRDERGHMSEKKRRLSVQQVKALEKSFEVEKKLEPDRKAKLAQELGLQPRQVAVWFQNRRARWKTKQLERDYGLLKASIDALKCNFKTAKHENESLSKKIRELKSKLKEEKSDSIISVKNEPIVSETDNQLVEPASTKSLSTSSHSVSDELKTDPNYDSYNNHVSIFKDRGSSDSSNSSGILNEDNTTPNAPISPPRLLHFTTAAAAGPVKYLTNSYQMQFVKIEEHDFFSGDEACNFFLDDQAPTLQW